MGLIVFYHPLIKPKDNQIRVACVGDSLTYGFLTAGQLWNNYPSLLKKLLGDKYCVNNYGYTNHTASKNGDFPYVKRKIYRDSLDFNPDIVILMLGSNDSKSFNWNNEEFKNDLDEIINSYKNLKSDIKIILMSPIPCYLFGNIEMYSIRDSVIKQEIRPICLMLGKENNIDYIDLYLCFENRKDLYAIDNVHLNKNGNQLIAETVYEHLMKGNVV